MSWLTRNKRHPGWLALQLHEDRIDLVHCKPGSDGRPQIALCDSFKKEGSPTSTLSRLCKEFKLNRYRCTTLLPVERYQLREIDAPPVPEAEVKAAVRWRMKEMIDYPLESAIIEVLNIPPDPAGAGASTALYAITARNDDVQACAGVFDSARLSLDAIDIPELAQRNVAALFEPDNQGVAMLAFYDNDGMLTFTRGGELYVSRRIELPLDQLMDGDLVRRTEHFARIALEVQRSLDHFERQYRYVSLSKLLLGPLPQDIGMHEYLASNIDGDVEPIDLATVMDVSLIPDLERPERQSQYLSAIGAALRNGQDASA